MKAVGVRELKNRLSEYLRLVRTGEEILVTDRGEVIAELSRPRPRVDVPYPALIGRPGLGVEMNEEAARKVQTKGTPWFEATT